MIVFYFLTYCGRGQLWFADDNSPYTYEDVGGGTFYYPSECVWIIPGTIPEDEL